MYLQVIECSWDVFTKQLGQASSLDEVIAAHSRFVDAVRRGTLLDEKSQVNNFFSIKFFIFLSFSCTNNGIFSAQDLTNHLRSVYSPILELQALEETFLLRANEEYEALMNEKTYVEATSEQDLKWGSTKSKETEIAERKNTFNKYLNSLSFELKHLSNIYQVTMKLEKKLL